MADFVNKSNIYQIIIIILVCLAWLLHIIGLASPYWTIIDLLDIHAGLFAQCAPIIGCSSGNTVPDWLSACQAFAILGIVTQTLLVVLKVISFFTDLLEKNATLLKVAVFSNLLLCFVSAGFIFLSVIIYGAYKDNMSWAWAFCILAFLMDNAAGVMTLRDFGTNVKLQRNAK